MCHSACQATNRFHLLGLLQLRFEQGLFFLCVFAFGGIKNDRQKHLVSPGINQLQVDLHRVGRVIRPFVDSLENNYVLSATP